MAQKKGVKKSSKIKLSMAFKKAVAVAAMSKLMQGAYNESSAARFVIAQVGDIIFPNKSTKDAAEALMKFRDGAIDEGSSKGNFVSIACFHYFHCIKLIDSQQFGPVHSAEVLLKTLLAGAGKNGKG